MQLIIKLDAMPNEQLNIHGLASETSFSRFPKGTPKGGKSRKDRAVGNEQLTRSTPLDNIVFPASNAWGIPNLLATHQAEYVSIPFIAWGSTSRRKDFSGSTVHFFVDDYRFSRLWQDPDQLARTACCAIVEPNYTVSLESPKAWVLFSIFQKRWLARYWQSVGIRVYVDLNVPVEYADLSLLGVPRGWKSYATRGYVDRLASLEAEYELAVAHADTSDINFIVYGGSKKVRDCAKSLGATWMPDEMDRSRGKFVE
jgi:hypothetical protein